MKPRAIISLTAVAVVAILSGVVLWRWTMDPETLGQFGLGGIFIASMLSHLTVVARDMFIPKNMLRRCRLNLYNRGFSQNLRAIHNLKDINARTRRKILTPAPRSGKDTGDQSMRWKVIFSIAGVVFVAALSTFMLWRWTTDPESLGEIGLGSIFIVSMVSHLTVVARDMFLPLYLPLSSIYHPLVLGASAGIGAAIGELTTYFLGWGVAESLEESVQDDSRLSMWIRKYGLWAVLLVAITPLPDTPIVLLAGSRKLSFAKLFAVECIGKTILYSLGAVVGGIVFTGLTGSVGSTTASVIMVVGSLVFCVLVTWRKSRDLIFGWFERALLN